MSGGNAPFKGKKKSSKRSFQRMFPNVTFASKKKKSRWKEQYKLKDSLGAYKYEQLKELTHFGGFRREGKEERQGIRDILTLLFLDHGLSFENSQEIREYLVQQSLEDINEFKSIVDDGSTLTIYSEKSKEWLDELLFRNIENPIKEQLENLAIDFLSLGIPFRDILQAMGDLENEELKRLTALHDTLDRAKNGKDQVRSLLEILKTESFLEMGFWGTIKSENGKLIEEIFIQLLEFNIPTKNIFEQIRKNLLELSTEKLKEVQNDLKGLNETTVDIELFKKVFSGGHPLRDVFLGYDVRTYNVINEIAFKIEFNALESKRGFVKKGQVRKFDRIIREKISDENAIKKVLEDIAEIPKLVDFDKLYSTKEKLALIDNEKAEKLNDFIENREGTIDEIRKALYSVDSSKDKSIKKVIEKLPNTEETLTVISDIEKDLLGSKTKEIGLTGSLHEAFFLKKTEVLEGLIHDELTGSEVKGNLAGLSNISKENYWKILIDGKVHEHDNKHFYNKSRGFMGGMLKGLYKIIKEVGKEISFSFLEELHSVATENVLLEDRFEGKINLKEFNSGKYYHWPAYIDESMLQKRGLKEGSNSWGHQEGSTKKGIEELKKLMGDLNLQWKSRTYIEKDNLGPRRWKSGFSESKEVTKRLIEYTIKKYKTDINKAQTEDQKIEVIIDCCRRLGVIHPFSDANGRTIQILVLNKLLMDNGLNPTVLQDQGQMIGGEKTELVKLIKEGQVYLQNLDNLGG